MFPSEIIVVPIVFGIPGVVLISRMWFRHKERMSELGRGSSARGEIEMNARLERMEQAIEAMAVELERVGEGQRFITRVLAERPSSAALGTGAAQGSAPPPPRAPV